MDVSQIIAALNTDTKSDLPVAAIEAAKAQRDALVPLFIRDIEQFTSTGNTQLGSQALFLAFHLLGDWREKSAYRPMVQFLRLPESKLDPILGDAITETIHRVVASVFDGDPESLYEIIHDKDAYEFVRSAMMKTLAILTLSGDLPRPQAVQFLRNCFDQLGPENNYVWIGWASAVARLGLDEMVPLVKQVFARGSIDRSLMGFKHFEEDLRAGPEDHENLTPFGDTCKELLDWFRAGKSMADFADMDAAASREQPKRNPFRDVGRNDPCPCGSGKKFKKCCYGIDPDDLMQRLAS